jgi:hypothetical protein
MTNPQPSHAPAPPRRIHPAAWAALAVAVIAVATAAFIVWPTQPSLAELASTARQKCGDDKRGFTVGDSGQSLAIDVAGTDDMYGLPPGSLDCVLDVIEVPDSVRARMRVTRVIDGPQSAEWDGYAMNWSERLGFGLAITIEQT